MSDIAWAFFAAGAVFIAMLVNGLLVEWLASYVVTDDAAQFGGFCFVLGGLLFGSNSRFLDVDQVVGVGTVIGCLAAASWLGVRIFRNRFRRVSK